VGLVLTGERSIGGIGTDRGTNYWWDWYGQGKVLLVGWVLTGESSFGGMGTDRGKDYWWDWY
jgi:hypothetical protein